MVVVLCPPLPCVLTAWRGRNNPLDVGRAVKRLRDHNKHIRQREALKAMLFKLGRRGADSDASRVTLCERVRAACFYLQRRLLTQSLKSVGLFVWQTEQWPDNTGKLDYVRVSVCTPHATCTLVSQWLVAWLWWRWCVCAVLRARCFCLHRCTCSNVELRP